MNLAQLTREQRLFGAAGAFVLFLISLFLPWFGVFDESVSATDAVASWWVLLIFAIVGAGVLVADGLGVQLPPVLRPVTLALYLGSVLLIVTLMYFLEGGGPAGREWGLFLAVIFAILAVAATFLVWREER